MNSILGRLSRLTLASVLVAYALVGGAIYVGIERYLERRVDDALHTKANIMGALLHLEGTRLEFEFDDSLMPEFGRARLPEYFELRRPDGSLFERSRSLADMELEKLRDAPRKGRSSWNIRLPDGRSGRAVEIPVFPLNERDNDLDGTKASEQFRLVLAQGAEDLDSVRGALGIGLVVGGLALFALVFLAIRWSLARGLEPLTELAKEVDAVTPESLDVEFSSADDVRELRGIRSRLDELIERLGSALERERRFTSAAAHELRTPLAELKTLAQVSDRWPEEHELRARVPRDVLALADRMQTTVESLLAFARATDTHAPSPSQSVDLSRLLTRMLESKQAGSGNGRAEISSSIEAGLCVHAIPTLVESVLRNLLDNAIAHGGGSIAVRAAREEGSIVVEMDNPRGDLEPSDLQHLFEPFWRKDASRHGDSHAGLGLALVDAWVKSWGGTIRAQLVGRDLVRFSIRLPAAQSSAANQ